MTNIGIVEYINALPFHLPFSLGELKTDAAFTFDVPSALNRSLRNGEIDMALSSSAEGLDGAYQRLSNFCIAAQKEIRSVNLYLKGPIEKARIALTPHSATSVSLLKVICHHFWNVHPQFVSMSEECDGFLLIGDEALKKSSIPGYQTFDLAKIWYEATGLPFVFAVFSVREGVEMQTEMFEKALNWSEVHREKLISEAHKRSGLPNHIIDQYYDLCFYRMGEKEQEGLKHFQQLRQCVSEICA